MLTVNHVAFTEQSAGLVKYGYWTEAVGLHTHAVGNFTSLGSYVAPTARLAVRWLQNRAIDIAEQMEPRDAWAVVHWLRSTDEHESALSTITAGRCYTCEFVDIRAATRFALSVRRITVAPLTGWLT